jgi:hypothetical protein
MLITYVLFFLFMGRNQTIYTADDISSSFTLEEIVSRYTNLEKKGNNYTGLCPFHVEKDPSFNVKGNLFKCFGCNETGIGVIEFIKRKERLDYKSAIEFLSKDIIPSKNLNKIIIPKNTINSEIVYDFIEMPFSKKHYDYFIKGGLDEEFLKNEGDIYAIKKFAVNKKVINIPEHRIMFAYVYKNIKGEETGHLKLLTIGADVTKAEKWRTNVPNNRLWYLYKYKNNPPKTLFIVKSNKDAVLNMKCGVQSIATQSENGTILMENIPILKKLFPKTRLVIAFGSDAQGVRESKFVSDKFNLNWFNIPRKYLSLGINDPFEYCKHFGIEHYINLLKQYNYIEK